MLEADWKPVYIPACIVVLAWILRPLILGEPNALVSVLFNFLWLVVFLLGLLALAVIAFLVWFVKEKIRLRNETPEEKLKREKDALYSEYAPWMQSERTVDLQSIRPPATGEIRKNYDTGIREVFAGEEWVPAGSDYTPVYHSGNSTKTKEGYCWAVPLDLENCLLEYFFNMAEELLEFALTIEGRKYRLALEDELWLRSLLEIEEFDERHLHTVLNESGIDAAQLEAHLRRFLSPMTATKTKLIAEIDEGEYVKRILFDLDFGRPILETWTFGEKISDEMQLVSSQGRSIKEILEMLVLKNMFSEAMRLAKICDWDIAKTVETCAQRKRMDDLRGLFAQAQEAGESIRHDTSLNQYRWTIRLEETRTAFWSVFFDDKSGEVMKYSLDIETASDSHYEFGHEAEKALRRKLNMPVESTAATHEILIGYLKKNRRQSLETLAKGVCDRQFHYS